MELKVLLVEDEALIAMMAQDMIEGLGHEIVHTAASLKDALDACTRDFDCALLDVNLNGDSSMPVAAALKERGCLFAFTTGYGAGGVDEAHRDVPVLGKPYALIELEQMLDSFAAQLAGTSSTTSSVDSNRG
jgi:CheY-like chemotaxis protein